MVFKLSVEYYISAVCKILPKRDDKACYWIIYIVVNCNNFLMIFILIPLTIYIYFSIVIQLILYICFFQILVLFFVLVYHPKLFNNQFSYVRVTLYCVLGQLSLLILLYNMIFLIKLNINSNIFYWLLQKMIRGKGNLETLSMYLSFFFIL